MPKQRKGNAIQGESRKPNVETPFRFAVRVLYDGTDFKGFQSQPHGNTIQDKIEVRLCHLLRPRKVRILGWGRTDSGVHASGAVFTVDLSGAEVRRLSSGKDQGKNKRGSDPATDNTIDKDSLILAANTVCSALKEVPYHHVPAPISARTVVPVPAEFDPRFSCLWKRYSYHISTGHKTSRSPFLARYAWQLDSHLDVDAMLDAVSLMNGRHNFGWMSVAEPGEPRNPVRDLKLSLEELPGTTPAMFHSQGGERTTVFKIVGVCDFFLYRMMRRIVGVVVSVGRGQVEVSTLQSFLELHDNVPGKRESGGSDNDGDAVKMKLPPGLVQTAPANGLCLERVEYHIPIHDEASP